jgi:hypothetical protein
MWRIVLLSLICSILILGALYETLVRPRWQVFRAAESKLESEKQSRLEAVRVEQQAKERQAELDRAIASFQKAVELDPPAAGKIQRLLEEASKAGGKGATKEQSEALEKLRQELEKQKQPPISQADQNEDKKRDADIDRRAQELADKMGSREHSEQADRVTMDIEKQRQQLRLHEKMFQAGVGVGSVVLLLGLDIGLLFALRRMGGKLSVETKIVIEKWGGKVSIAGAGLVGCFLALVCVSLLSLYLVSHMNR